MGNFELLPQPSIATPCEYSNCSLPPRIRWALHTCRNHIEPRMLAVHVWCVPQDGLPIHTYPHSTIDCINADSLEPITLSRPEYPVVGVIPRRFIHDEVHRTPIWSPEFSAQQGNRCLRQCSVIPLPSIPNARSSLPAIQPVSIPLNNSKLPNVECPLGIRLPYTD